MIMKSDSEAPKQQGEAAAPPANRRRARKPSAKAAIATRDTRESKTDALIEDEGDERSFIQSLAKGLTVIQTFNGSQQPLTLARVAERTGLSRAAVRRVLITLEKLGFVARRDERHFVLTPRVLSLGYAYLTSMPLWAFAEPIMENLVHEVRETCTLAMLDDTEAVYVLRIPIHRILHQGVTVGSRLPAYCTSYGRVLLSDLSPVQLDTYFSRARLERFTDSTLIDIAQLREVLNNVRRKGYSWVQGEMQEYVCGLSVPVFDAEGRVVAAINMSANRPDVSEKIFVREHLPMLKRAAERMNSSLVAGANHGPVRHIKR
jgi:IclR family pca regulon transcriptional regulator